MLDIGPDPGVSEARLDWADIARVLGEWADKPIVVLDADGVIRLFNRSMEKILGWTRFEMEGRRWSALRGVDEPSAEQPWIHAALKGTIQRQEVRAETKTGGRVTLDLEVRALGWVAHSRALLLHALRVTPQFSAGDPSQWREIDYEISVAGSEFGRLRRVRADGELLPDAHFGGHCYSAFHNLTGPCPDCPLLQRGAPIRKVLVRDSGPACDHYDIVTSQILDDSTARIQVRTLSGSVLTAIHETKLQRLCDKGRLSSREREVLGQLLQGRSVEEIADAMGIRARTVKYHQANVLQKVGADSRTDLLRLLQ